MQDIKTISVTFIAKDEMSKALNGVAKNVSGTANTLTGLQSELYKAGTTAEQTGATISKSGSIIGESMADGTTGAKGFTSSINGVNGAVKSLIKSMAPLAIVAGAFKSAAGVVTLIDDYTGLQARLKLIAGDLSKARDLNAQIYASAQRARGGYSEMADNVSKLGLLAGHAFSSNDEMVVFVEQLQKQFKIAGAGAQEASSAMYQLTQAMASGRLQGDEFRSIMENAPMLAQAIAKEMDVPISKMRELSSEGAITSDIIKRALTNENAIKEVNAQFDSIPMKFSEIVTKLQNIAQVSFAGVFSKISGAINSDGMTKIIDGISLGIQGMAKAAEVAIGVMYTLGGVLSWTADTLGSLASIVLGVAPVVLGLLVTAGAAYLGWLIATNAQWVIAGALLVPSMAALATMTAIHWAINGAMAVKNGLLVAYNTITSIARIKTIALTGATRLFNFVLMANPLGIIIGLVAGLVAFFGLLQLRTLNVREALASTWESIALGAGEAINFIIDKLNLLIQAMNSGGKMFGKLFGFEYEEIKEIGHISTTGAAKAGGDFFRTFSMEKMMEKMTPKVDIPAVGNIENMTKSIEENTKGIKDALDENFASVDELRQLALGDAVSNITKQDIKIEVVNHNTVNNEMDIDGIGDTIAQSLFKAVQVNRNGVAY